MIHVYTSGGEEAGVTTRKYDNLGAEKWAVSEDCDVWGVTVDAAGNVYTGSEQEGGTTRKYDSSGNLLWAKDHGYDVFAIAVDSAGNVYTGGAQAEDGNTTRKYDADGDLLWSVDHGNIVYGIAVDSVGNVYTAGDPVSPGDDTTTRKYDSSGALLWSVSHGDTVHGIAVDRDGNVATAGFELPAVHVRKYNTSGALLWSASFGERAWAAAFDMAGNLYIGGERNNSVSVRKYNAAGTQTLTLDTDADVWGVTVDAEGNIYTVGTNNDEATTYKFSPAGALLWSVDHGLVAYSVAVDPPPVAPPPRGGTTGLPGGGGGGGGTLPDWPIDIIDRDGSGPLGYYKLTDIRPTLLSWDAIGGCDRATFRAVAGELDLWQLVNTLRCGIHVGDGRGGSVWWGYVHSVDLDLGSYSFGVSLDNLANRIAVAYEYLAAGVDASGTRATTDWAEDTDSMTEFGTFERLESLSSADEYDAEARRDALLEVLAWPQPTIDFGDGKLSATMQAYGWHHILKRRYYSNVNAVGTMTTDQMADLLDEVGEFFTEIDIGVESGIYSNEFRDGDTSAWEEFRALLESGWTQTDEYADPEVNVRLLCYVTPHRVLRVFREPYPGVSDLRLYPNGTIENQYGGVLQPGPWLVGKWARLVNIVPPQISLQPVVHPTRVFIERAEYDVERMRLRPQPRGLSAYQVGGIQPG